MKTTTVATVTLTIPPETVDSTLVKTTTVATVISTIPCQVGYTGYDCSSCDTDNNYNGSRKPGSCVRNQCICPNGQAVADEKCTLDKAIQCSSCNTGYVGLDCKSCDTAKNYNDSKERGKCVPNQCTCPNGKTVLHEKCDSDGATKCWSCNTGYDGQDCKSCDMANNYNGSRQPGSCVPNQCICPNGKAVPHKKCTSDGATKCSSCNTGYTGSDCNSCAINYTQDTENPYKCVPSLHQTISDTQQSTCAVKAQGICIYLKLSSDVQMTSDADISNVNHHLKLRATTNSGKTTSFILAGAQAGEIIKRCDCRDSSSLESNEKIKAVDITGLHKEHSLALWKIADIKVDINPGEFFMSHITALNPEAKRWIFNPQQPNYFSVTNSATCENNYEPCCNQRKICELIIEPLLEISEDDGTRCAPQGQGVCLMIETHSSDYSDTSGKFNLTVITSTGKSSRFIVKGFNEKQILKVCDCRPSETFIYGENIKNIEVQAIGTYRYRNNGWKVKKLMAYVNPGIEFISKFDSLTNPKHNWWLDLSNKDGFWIDENKDCPFRSDPCCANQEKCSLAQEEIHIPEDQGLYCATKNEGICITLQVSNFVGSPGEFEFTVKTNYLNTTKFTLGKFNKGGEVIKVCDCRPNMSDSEKIESVEVSALDSNTALKLTVLSVIAEIHGPSAYSGSTWLLETQKTGGFWIGSDTQWAEIEK